MEKYKIKKHGRCISDKYGRWSISFIRKDILLGLKYGYDPIYMERKSYLFYLIVRKKKFKIKDNELL